MQVVVVLGQHVLGLRGQVVVREVLQQPGQQGVGLVILAGPAVNVGRPVRGVGCPGVVRIGRHHLFPGHQGIAVAPQGAGRQALEVQEIGQHVVGLGEGFDHRRKVGIGLPVLALVELGYAHAVVGGNDEVRIAGCGPKGGHGAEEGNGFLVTVLVHVAPTQAHVGPGNQQTLLGVLRNLGVQPFGNGIVVLVVVGLGEFQAEPVAPAAGGPLELRTHQVAEGQGPVPFAVAGHGHQGHGDRRQGEG